MITQVQAASIQVNEFIKKVEEYQRDYPSLLLISTQKILLLSNILSEVNPSIVRIMCEIIHITSIVREEIETEIEVAHILHHHRV